MTFRFDVRVIAASISPWGDKIATIVARYPRFIHSEVMTHKDLSRNASSSRAIPFKKLLKLTRQNMAAPIHWGKNQPGMSASDELENFSRFMAIFMWHMTGHIVLTLAWLMSFTGVHKQVINRMIEPWTYINVQLTATNWKRMLGLRLPNDAQPEFRELARAIQDALQSAYYMPLKEGEWHVPWITHEEWADMYNGPHRSWDRLKQLSAARSARLSYTPIGDTRKNPEKDQVLANNLLQKFHLSPFEHQATPRQGKHANLEGWSNYRTELGF